MRLVIKTLAQNLGQILLESFYRILEKVSGNPSIMNMLSCTYHTRIQLLPCCILLREKQKWQPMVNKIDLQLLLRMRQQLSRPGCQQPGVLSHQKNCEA